MGVKDSFPGGAGGDIPDNQHRVIASVGSNNDIQFTIIGGGRYLIALNNDRVVRVLVADVAGCFRSQK